MRNKSIKKKEIIMTKKWLLMLIKFLPVKDILDLLLELLRDLAKKSDNELDDGAVEIIQKIIDTAFGQK